MQLAAGSHPLSATTATAATAAAASAPVQPTTKYSLEGSKANNTQEKQTRSALTLIRTNPIRPFIYLAEFARITAALSPSVAAAASWGHPQPRPSACFLSRSELCPAAHGQVERPESSQQAPPSWPTACAHHHWKLAEKNETSRERRHWSTRKFVLHKYQALRANFCLNLSGAKGQPSISFSLV